ncbi:hypothetical protein FGADI_3303 [Fusarium gaditjirri]|uniref:Uncharacterized protein n=1 Tax=Fusarium gaditjirri TaxID=282569 RepID=A0A8H4TFX5_9HYPO|nr:hypothetical protein FGADI_3303 [Fusarium gaditjirri]
MDEPLIGEYYGIDERGHNTFTLGFEARVWIIRSKKDLTQTEKPHHYWVKVRKPEFGDPGWVEQDTLASGPVEQHMVPEASPLLSSQQRRVYFT